MMLYFNEDGEIVDDNDDVVDDTTTDNAGDPPSDEVEESYINSTIRRAMRLLREDGDSVEVEEPEANLNDTNLVANPTPESDNYAGDVQKDTAKDNDDFMDDDDHTVNVEF